MTLTRFRKTVDSILSDVWAKIEALNKLREEEEARAADESAKAHEHDKRSIEHRAEAERARNVEQKLKSIVE